MMEAYARVQRIERGLAWLKISDNGAGCGRCDEPGGCRSVQITNAFGLARDEFSLPYGEGTKVGDRVLITIPDGAALRAALASYGLGVVLLLCGAAAGSTLGDAGAADLYGALGAVAGLALALLVNRLLARSRRWRGGLRMELVAEGACAQKPPYVRECR